MTLAALFALITAWLPTLAVGAGPLSIVLGFLQKLAPNRQTWLRIGAIVAALVAVAGATVHYMNLRADAEALAELAPKIAALEASLGCPARPPQERDLFACIPARDRDAAAARVEAVRQAGLAALAAQDALQKQSDQLRADLDQANDAIADAAEADDGPVPKVMRDNWSRERAKRGIK